MKNPFIPADILLPSAIDEKWPVVACDQFTSQPEYWAEAEEIVGEAASTLKMILPEVYLSGDTAGRIASINKTMAEYMQSDIFCLYGNAMVYVERVLPDGSVRRGLVGAVDLEAYDFSPKTTLPVRATEGTVLSRIPPRVEIRKDAPAELPHVMLLADDAERTVIEPLSEIKNRFRKLYDTKLMLGGGSITGYLLDEDLVAGGRKYTEYTDELLSYIDVLVDGPFVMELKSLSLKFKGSKNQRVIDMKVYRECGMIEELRL